MKDLITNAKSLISGFFLNWKTPGEGRYCNNREIFSLSFGGIGVKFVVYCISQMLISSTNVLLGNTIGIEPTPLYIIYIISLITQFPLTALRANMIDNSRHRSGKYRPYLIRMGIPSVILAVGFIWMPYEIMSQFWKCLVVLLFNIGFQFFYNFYFDCYDSIVNVLSPNSTERFDIISIRNIVDNLAPSILNPVFPLLAKAVTGQNTLYDLKVYRYVFPIVVIIGFCISLLCYVNTEEKIVRAKNHFVGIRFSDALIAVAKNKYFWIISLAGWLGFLEASYNNILAWMYNYQGAATAGQYAIIILITGNASLWPNIVGPFLIRRYGKKKILLFTNILNIGIIALMYPVVRAIGVPNIIWVLVACIFVNSFISGLGHLLMPAINADIRDYQQYVSGERIDGMFAAVGLIGNIITMFTGLVLPVIYERSGLNSEVATSLGYTNVYDVLYNKEYFVQIGTVLVIASIIGAVMNVIPYFFFDLTEVKQKSMVEVLKLRAAIEESPFGDLSEKVNSIISGLRENLQISPFNIDEELNKLNMEKSSISETEYKKRVKALKKKAKSKECREQTEKKEIASFVADEIRFFDTQVGALKLKNSLAVLEFGMNDYLNIVTEDKSSVKSRKKDTPEEKLLRKTELEFLSSIERARKTMAKHFPDGISDYNTELLNELFDREEMLEKEIKSVLEKLNNKTADNNAKDSLNSLRNSLKKTRTLLKAEQKKAVLFHSVVAPYIEAQRIEKLYHCYSSISLEE